MRFAQFALAAAVALTACDKPSNAHRPREREPAKARIEATLELPAGDGRIHIVAVPTGHMESTRCVVVTSGAGGPAVACTPKDFDLPPPDE